MLKAGWMVLLNISMLLPAAGFADDSKSPGTDSEPPPVLTVSKDASLTELKYASRWQLLPPAKATANSKDRIREIADLEFQNASALGHVRKLNSLSMLTLAEIGQNRLFLGVNEEGLVGLHFGNFSYHRDDGFLEVARMPYLKESSPTRDLE